MKLFSASLELAAVKSICSSKDELVKAKLLGSLNKTYFQYPPAKAAYERLSRMAKKRGEILSYSELVEDPALDEEYRDVLRDSESPVCKDAARADKLLEKLSVYRKTRILYDMAKSVAESLKGNKVDIDQLLDSVTDQLSAVRSNTTMEKIVRSIGAGGNAVDMMAEALAEESAKLYKTGFKDFDDKNGGLPSAGVVIIAATTSGGKSTLLMNLLINLYLLNKISVANVSLEMPDLQLTNRIGSRLTRIPFWKFKQKRLSKEEKKKAKRAWKKLHEFGEENDCNFAIIAPDTSCTIDEALMLVKPYNYDVLAIDYVGLLEGADTEKQALALSNIVRQAKIFSNANDCLIILLAQLDKGSGDIRYSRAMEEHADNVWAWSYFTEEQRSTGILNIEQRKARDQELFPFELKEMFEVMSVANMDEEVEIDGETPKSMKEKSFAHDHTDSLSEEPDIDFDSGQR
jgi:replicative DNA helicase